MSIYNETQPLRRSQFIQTYGPGAIIETKKGPRLIPSLDKGLPTSWDNILNGKYDIDDPRMCQYLKNQLPKDKDGKQQEVRIFAIPTNENNSCYAIYRTQIFPRWKICNNTSKHEGNHSILHSDFNRCPVCGESVNSEKHSTVRFVAACSDGHLDDISWNFAVHYNQNKNCTSKYFFWDAKGSTLASIRITCPKCHSGISMQEIYTNVKFKCTGEYIEKKKSASFYKNNIPSSYYTDIKSEYGNCDAPVKIIQRQASSLRLANIITLVTIPKYDDPAGRILQRREIQGQLKIALKYATDGRMLNDPSELPPEELDKAVNLLIGISQISKDILLEKLESNGVIEFLKLLNQYEPDAKKTYADYMKEELETLLAGDGLVPDNHFKMGQFRNKSSKSGRYLNNLRICPVERIRTVTVQTGYVRPISNIERVSPKVIDISACGNENEILYPGFEGFGEGLFVHCDKDILNNIHYGNSYNKWKEYGVYEMSSKDRMNTHDGLIISPEFVWIHTLSHILSKAISEFAGYSSASIRERIYYNNDKNEGGILLYNTAPGEDGSLGGLVDIVEIFDEILDRAEDIIEICSNDPLCSDVKQDGTKVNGAACYSCLLISETACEHGNKWLDRNLFLEGHII